MDAKQYYSTQELHEMTGIPRSTFQYWARVKKLPGQVRLGRLWRFRKDLIDKALENNEFFVVEKSYALEDLP